MLMNLRIELIILALFFLIMVIRNVNSKKLQLKYSLIWIFASVILAVIAFFPELAINATYLLGFETPSNFIFWLCIVFLIALSFSLTIIVSKQSEKIKKMIQLISINNKEKNDEKIVFSRDIK